MAKKTSNKSIKKVKKKSKVISGGIGQNNGRLRKIAAIYTVLMIAAIGSYLLVVSWAQPNFPLPSSNPGRGLYYNGMKVVDGHCQGAYVLENDTTSKNDVEKPCVHPDPGPPNQDVRIRAKTIEAQLYAQAAQDQKNPPTASEAPPIPEAEQVTADNVGGRGDLGNVKGRSWPCIGTGTGGSRVQMIYVYKKGEKNRRSDLRSGFESIARRMNAVVYNSAEASGYDKGMQIRFATTNKCELMIGAVEVGGDLGNAGNIQDQVAKAGFKASDRKYVIWIDFEYGCGLGGMALDDQPSASANANNGGPSYSFIWKGCWNYAEPHELAHNLGAVQLSAPHATKHNHCYDQNDIMCYDDDGDGGVSMRSVCELKAAIWRYDCGRDDYFDAADPTGYLVTHWNIALSYFLEP